MRWGWRALAAAGCLAWLTGTLAGFRTLARYESRPGREAAPPVAWAGGTDVALDPTLPTLLAFAHPRCPCTRASLGELSRVLARTEAQVRAHVFFYADPTLGSAWHRTELWERAESWPGVEVHEDPRGEIAARFDAHTSGQVLLYAPDGELLYRGGVTSARGHAGDNAGARSLVALLRGKRPETSAARVFGCAIQPEPEPGPAVAEAPR